MKCEKKSLECVGILTFTYGDNYGQRLQNLAMQEFLKKYFCEVYTIRQAGKKSPLFIQIKHTIKLLLEGKFFVLRRRNDNFNRFNNLYIQFFDTPIDSSDTVSFPKDNFDYFVCGSDQIWSPYSCDVNSTYFLTFVEKNKRIALAPSIAAEDIPQERIAEFREYFKGFNCVSTREYSGSKLVGRLTGNTVETLIDPTLLFDSKFWSTYEKCPKNMPKEEYAVCYFLGDSSQTNIIYEICQSESLTVIDIFHNKRYLSLGPDEFLYLIHHAKKVFTDSYHGAIFSIIFHIPLILCKREGTIINMSSRFETLFSKLGIEVNQSSSMMNEIQVKYSEVDNNILHEKNIFENFLKKSMSKNSN